MIERRTVDVLETILAGVGTIDRRQLLEAVQSADKMNCPLSRALLMLGAKESEVRLPMEAKELVIHKEITIDVAIKACRLASQNSMSLQDAINVLEKIHKTTQNIQLMHPYTDLLLSADIITREQFGRALMRSQDTKMNLGRILVINREITNITLCAALHGHILVRDAKISKDDAVKALKLANQRKIYIEQVLFELGIYSERSNGPMRLGELFAMASYLTESDMLDCTELELVKGKQIGQILVEHGFVTKPQLESAVYLQNLVDHSSLKPFQAAQILRKLRGKDVTPSAVKAELARMNPAIQPQLKIGELLVQADLVEQEVLNEVLVDRGLSTIKTGRMLLDKKSINEASLMNALRCLSLSRQGYLSNDHAIKLLQHCYENNVTPDDALQKTGWYFPSRMQWVWQ
jgi:hypothetical protein